MPVPGSFTHLKPLHPQGWVQGEKHDEIVQGNNGIAPFEGRTRQHPTRMRGQSLPQQSKPLGHWPWRGEGRVRGQPVSRIGVKVRRGDFFGYCPAEGTRSRSGSTKNMYAGHRRYLVKRRPRLYRLVPRGERGQFPLRLQIPRQNRLADALPLRGFWMPAPAAGCTGVRQKAFRSCIVALSRAPTLCRSAAVLCSASSRRVRQARSAISSHLHDWPFGQQPRQPNAFGFKVPAVIAGSIMLGRIVQASPTHFPFYHLSRRRDKIRHLTSHAIFP